MEKGYITAMVTVPDEDYSDLSEVLQFFGFTLIDEVWQLQPGKLYKSKFLSSKGAYSLSDYEICLTLRDFSGPLDPLVVTTVEKSLPLSAEAVSIVTSRTIGPTGDQDRDSKHPYDFRFFKLLSQKRARKRSVEELARIKKLARKKSALRPSVSKWKSSNFQPIKNQSSLPSTTIWCTMNTTAQYIK